MSKPDDIPQDVWDAAVDCGGTPDELGYAEVNVEHIARAILAERKAERERCAGIAERDGSSHSAPYPHTAEWMHETGLQVRTADRIAAAIRGQP